MSSPTSACTSPRISQSDKLETIREHVTLEQYGAIVRFIANNDFSKHSLDIYISDIINEIAETEEHLKKISEAQGIYIIYWNRFQRRDNKNPRSPRVARTPKQQKFIQKTHPDTMYEQETSLIDALEEILETRQPELEHLRAIRDVYIELFPSAVQMPKVVRSQLPFIKSKSSPSLSPRTSPTSVIASSPTRSLMEEHVVDAFAGELDSSPRRRSTSHRYSRSRRSRNNSRSSSRSNSRSNSRTRSRADP